VERQDRAEEEARPSLHGVVQFDPDSPPPAVTLYNRASTFDQSYSPGLRWLRKRCEECGTEVIAAAGENATGKTLSPDVRPVFHKMLAKASGNALLVPCFSRLLRSEAFDVRNNQEACPGTDRVRELAALATDHAVKLMTYLPPDSSPEDDRAFMQKLANEAPKAGRPPKRFPGYRKALRERFSPTAQAMYKEGKTWAEIARYVEGKTGLTVGPETVRDWALRAWGTEGVISVALCDDRARRKLRSRKGVRK
jgi:DNA invertase Pin-like site-specific DNA recombinase